MKKFIRGIFAKFGYDIIKRDSGLPSSQTLYANLCSLIAAYEQLFQQVENININKNELRTSLLIRGSGTRPPEAYFIIKGLAQTKNIKGDVCEFGVAQGETSALIANEIRETKKTLHLFDSFQGLSRPTSNDTLKDDIFLRGDMQAYFGAMKYPKNWVTARLNNINYSSEQYFIHEGYIDDIFKSDLNLPIKVAFAYLDFDLYEPTKAALEFLESRTDSGAVVIIDDYDFFSTGVKKAVDEFIQTHAYFNIKIPPIEFGHFAILQRQN